MKSVEASRIEGRSEGSRRFTVDRWPPEVAGRRRRIAGIAVLGIALAGTGLGGGCGGPAEVTVQGKKLVMLETNYGQADYYCNKLANGQYMVIITDFLLCDGLHAGKNSRQLFHSFTESNLRMIFRASNLKKIPPTNTFKVGRSNCSTTSDPDTEAIAYFSHHAEGSANYEINVQAESGTITVQYPEGNSELHGTYDLNFPGGENLKGDFHALFCMGIGPGFAD